MTVLVNSVFCPPTPGNNTNEPGQFFNLAPLGKLTQQERHQFVSYGRGPSQKPSFPTLSMAIERYAKETPFAIAAIDGRQTISYRELNSEAEKLATLLQRLKVKSGDSVGVFLSRSIPMLIGMLACLKIGANYVPQHAGVAPNALLSQIIDVARIRVVFTLSKHKHDLPQKDGTIRLELDTLLKSPEFKSMEASGKRITKPDDVCFILFTSGTTGRPNGVQVTHKNVANIVMTSPGNLGIKPGMRVGQILSIAFDMSAWEIYAALCHGATLLIRDNSIQQTAANADVIIATPSILGQIDPDSCPDVKTVAVAGEPCPLPLAEVWGARCDFYNSCGPTETTIINTAKLFKPGDRLSIGKPTPNNTVYVLNEDLTPCAIGEVGEMWAGGVCVTKGYLANAELSQASYRPDPFLGDGHVMFRTRDLGRWNKDGELEHFGRTDDQVKMKGFRVELDSVSSTLEKIPECRLAVTLKVNDQQLASFVVPASVNEKAAIKHVAANLPYYAVPVRVLATDELPLTDRGKIDKRKLLTLFNNAMNQTKEGEA
ncbi:AMP-binding protein [Grimontia kaedaensis]|uniref:AMP-binding protein n=1 Tax=Grimontia kaedaensis TaxID=2872157 RepID=A0ABY4WZU8_9GAMM|nr:AMP-binding protein [Grimontia kaedaensis]USH04497.1 AMP-binding protein [Grimontia kaedaensis]